MMCLACQHDNAYGREQCSACHQALAAGPPFLHPNHVSQLREAIEATVEGRLDRDAFLSQLDAFEALYHHLDGEWDLSVSLADRLEGNLRGRADVLQALQTIDTGLELLRSGLGSLETLRDGHGPISVLEVEALGHGGSLLMEFFRATCSGCATLLQVLDTSAAPADRLGSLIDIQVS